MKISFKHISYFFLFILGVNMALVSCTSDLDVKPRDKNEFLSEDFFKDPTSYKQVLAKLYAGLYVGGNDGDGKPDIAGLGGDFSSYLRLLFVTQELPTDEAIIAWADGDLPTLNTQNWSPANEFLSGIFSRAFYEISVANEFLRQTTDDKLTARGVDANLKAEIVAFRAEARFLRAFSYYNLMDLFGNVPITTEADPVGLFYPVQKTRAEVFAFVESELKDMDKTLVDSKANEYGRIDKTAAKFLLAQIYLNSKVYTGVDRNNEAAVLCNEIINGSAYTFADVPYRYLFSANNDRNGAEREFIFPIIGDGNAIRATGGGMSFIIHASIGGSMVAADQGMDGGWEGTRARREFVKLFPDVNATADERGTFYTDGQSLDISNVGVFTDGYAVTKFINVNSDGTKAQRPDIPDTDFPMFRLSDVYLMYAEATVRGASSGDMVKALDYVNKIRKRANAKAISNAELTLDFLLDERGRELFWECHRRTDLIRFGKFTGGSKTWQWKGGTENGSSTESYRDLMPIPARNIQANPTLKQNLGY
ncbi:MULTISPECIES: RagB/SusD family nutrient uptake outer membrane protein [unclassified Flavobacterium]|uniref:RagB/SusD family nutrient uptake outer membrane protein n=1 Tax=unclassified Flavobacterium TaxID=196869 RepID=UPI000F0BF469|nr:MULTISPECIES: RagB/SusD family nutrient uptake outer membrane protein [unclassified Flavobacterium]AYN05437.1 RagB/SusD family nutrient uptake outer membrane protein [Flavobacterium sp. 140616W15]MCD0473408.1 RagB/SusD family nutrient uptake outer membrane protein [Flavobacterium sp. EDS]